MIHDKQYLLTPGSRFPYIEREDFDSWVDLLLAQKLSNESPLHPLINAVLATGHRLIQGSNRHKSAESSIDDQTFSAAIGASCDTLMHGEATVLKIQVS